MAIEKASFPDPYSEPFFWWLKLKVKENFIVAETEKVVGYAISEIRGGRGHIISMAADELELAGHCYASQSRD